MSRWVKLPVELVWDPRVLTVSLAARGLLLSLLALSDGDGVFRVAPGTTPEQSLAAVACVPDARPQIEELTQRGLVLLGADSVALLTRTQHQETEAGKGKSSAERVRAYRQRQRAVTEPVVTSNVTDTVTGNVTVTTNVTPDVTEPVTVGNDGCNDDVTPPKAKNPAQKSLLNDDVTGCNDDVTPLERKKEKRERKKVPPKPPSGGQEPMPWTLAELTAALDEASGGKIVVAPFVAALAPPLTLVVRQLAAQNVTLDDVRVVGEWVKAGGCDWMRDPIGLSWLAKAGNLADAVGKARAWRQKQADEAKQDEESWGKEWTVAPKAYRDAAPKVPTPREVLQAKGLA